MRTRRDDLAELPLFSEVSRAQLSVIRRALTKVHVPAGCVLVEEGARGDKFMVISDGEAVVSRGVVASRRSGVETWWARWPSSREMASAAAMPR